MPELKDVTTMITAARSRQIRFDLIIQNFAQLNQVYGKENAETIKGNCGNMIYLLSSELNALEEISKLCGDRKVKGKGKDKPDETRPLISVTDLQRLKFKDAIIKKQRVDPFQTKLKGVNEYNWNIPQYEKAQYPSREKRTINLFDLKTFVKDKKKDLMVNSGFPNMESPSIIPPFQRKPLINPKQEDNEFDVDELIKKIDAKIAELEKEEAENNKNSQELSFENINDESLNSIINNMNDVKENNDNLQKIIEPNQKESVKIVPNIDKIIEKIEDEDISDDEFFDDFFFDE